MFALQGDFAVLVPARVAAWNLPFLPIESARSALVREVLSNGLHQSRRCLLSALNTFAQVSGSQSAPYGRGG